MSVIDTKLVKTRKIHYCCGCEKRFNKGSYLLRTTYINEDKEIDHHYTCDKCRAYCADNNIREWEDGEIGELIKDDKEWNKNYIKEQDNG